MHRFDDETEQLAQAILDYARRRLILDPVPLDGPRPMAELQAAAGQTITEDGLGGQAALALFDDVLSKACISVDHPRYLSFIPAAPTEAATALRPRRRGLVDLRRLVARGRRRGLRREPGAALDRRPRRVPGRGRRGLRPGRHARQPLRARRGPAHRGPASASGRGPTGWVVACSAEAHSSIAHAARVMDIDLLKVPVDERGRLAGAELERGPGRARRGQRLRGRRHRRHDELRDRRRPRRDLGASRRARALAARRRRLRHRGARRTRAPGTSSPASRTPTRSSSTRTSGCSRPFDACALIYRDPALGKAAHTQTAGYLDVITEGDGEWNPSDYAYHLSRRARGLPMWFSLATHGTRAYTDAIEGTLDGRPGGGRRDPLARPTSSCCANPTCRWWCSGAIGWTAKQYYDWSDRLMAANFAFVTPTSHDGETVTRFAIVNPRTTVADITAILDTMA